MTTEWIPTGGKKPILPSDVFVYVRFAGDSREEAEAYRDGYGQSVDSVHSWADTIEYRRKHPAPMTNDQTVTQALEPCPFCGSGDVNPNGICRYSKGHEAWWADGTEIRESFFVNCGKCGISNRGMFGHRTRELAITAWNTRTAHSGESRDFQSEVGKWMLACFGEEIAADKIERADRFVEEALELAQTIPGFTVERALALVEYVFGRPVGERGQEVGGVGVTLAALCNTYDLNIAAEWERELARVWTKVEAIRAKQATKPVGSALPVAESGEGREGAEHCRKCGRDNPSWSAPSPLWNAVMRGGSVDGNPIHDDLVCPSCFIGLAMDAGIASGWRLIATDVNVLLETVTPSGRVWDDAAFLWDEQHSSHSGEGRSNGAGEDGYLKIPTEAMPRGPRRDAVVAAAMKLAPYSADPAGTPTRDGLVFLNAAINEAAAAHFAALAQPEAGGER